MLTLKLMDMLQIFAPKTAASSDGFEKKKQKHKYQGKVVSSSLTSTELLKVYFCLNTSSYCSPPILLSSSSTFLSIILLIEK